LKFQVTHGPKGKYVKNSTPAIPFRGASDYVPVFAGSVWVRVYFANNTWLQTTSFQINDNTAYTYVVGTNFLGDSPISGLVINTNPAYAIGTGEAAIYPWVIQDNNNPPAPGNYQVRVYQLSEWYRTYLDFGITSGSNKFSIKIVQQGDSASSGDINGTPFEKINTAPSATLTITVTGSNSKFISPITIKKPFGVSGTTYDIFLTGNVPSLAVVKNQLQPSVFSYYSIKDTYGCVHSGEVDYTDELPGQSSQSSAGKFPVVLGPFLDSFNSR